MENIESGELFSDTKIIENSRKEENEYRKIGKFCDFTLKLKSTGASIKVHKVVLASSCPYFRAMFDSEMIECVKGYLEFKDFISEAQLENIIEYLYTGRINIPFSAAKIYYEHAIYFRLKCLANFCTILLIKNIQTETCLDLWRFGVKFCNEHLKNNALDYILLNADKLFDHSDFLDLTAEEIKTLISDDKMSCSEEKIYSFVMKWLNHDFENRTYFINNLIEEIRFPLMSDRFMTSEVLTNDFLLENKDFLIIATKILKSKLDTSEISCLKFNKINSPRVGFRQKNLVAVLDKTIYHFGPEEDDVLPMTSLTGGTHIGARITTFAKNYLLLTGGENSKNCEYYCPVTYNVKPFPAMSKGRFRHGVATLQDKIYCCGGVNNHGSVEVFDIGAGIWSEGTSLSCELYDFGITTWDNCIYVMGGSNESIAERYDPREDKWSLLPPMPANLNASFTRSFAFNNSVYAFSLSTGFIFDVRAEKWIEDNVCSPPYNWNFFDLTEIDGKVYAMGEYYSCYKYYYCYTYDIITNTWLDMAQKLPSHEDVSVITMLT
ncbi:kelch-like protein 18 isoform X2 [Condylostylus longicornis]|uniref:kelch-like protein 18 isoform X2 n=1 Tax=Condylostylus longicornis TaxID=2530218 RepID=UPI00244E12A7|nr:kelch-like protein 18 isoform X2 [Condylostylus longicornis]